jgi:hypothetical protein
LPNNADVFPSNLDPVITTVPPLSLPMAPPPNCQKHNNKPIEAAVLELVLNEAFEE